MHPRLGTHSTFRKKMVSCLEKWKHICANESRKYCAVLTHVWKYWSIVRLFAFWQDANYCQFYRSQTCRVFFVSAIIKPGSYCDTLGCYFGDALCPPASSCQKQIARFAFNKWCAVNLLSSCEISSYQGGESEGDNLPSNLVEVDPIFYM
jgi:hypothetical protein